MHPALSVIALTTLIGMGQGFFLALFSVQMFSVVRLLPEQDNLTFYGLGSFLVLVLLALGLVFSFFHLGRPERAWRAATMWRTSWLSREVIVLPAAMFFIFLYGVAHLLDYTRTLFDIAGIANIDLTFILGLMASVLVLALYLCTGMIYAAIRFIPEWRTPLTPLNFFLLGMGSGFLLAAVFATLYGKDVFAYYLTTAIVFTLLGFVSRSFSLWRNASRELPATIQSAIGVKHPHIVQKSQGSMGGSFNTREFNHGKTPRFLKTVKWGFVVSAFIVPLVLMMMASYASTGGAFLLLLIALLVQYAGLFAERWYFFAEASHPQNIYYQAKG